jgi:hypothetical protein
MYYKVTGGVVQINKYDLPIVEQYAWHIGSRGYALTNLGDTKKEMHLILMGPAEDGKLWDHKNRDKLDNRRCNLRQVTRSENLKNSDWYESGELHQFSRERFNEWWAILRKHGLNKLSQLDQAWKLESMGV